MRVEYMYHMDSTVTYGYGLPVGLGRQRTRYGTRMKMVDNYYERIRNVMCVFLLQIDFSLFDFYNI